MCNPVQQSDTGLDDPTKQDPINYSNGISNRDMAFIMINLQSSEAQQLSIHSDIKRLNEGSNNLNTPEKTDERPSEAVAHGQRTL